jgi:hypothetical protein
MNLQEFSQYRSNCPVCNTTLKLYAEIYFSVQYPKNEFDIPGSIIYSYDINQFIKTSYKYSTIDNKQIIEYIYTNSPDTFSHKKRIHPKIKISDYSTNKINIIDYGFVSSCISPNHSYYCTSNSIEPNHNKNAIKIASETLATNKHTIISRFPSRSTIIILPDKSYHYLPSISITAWSISDISNQISKYLLLK